MKLLAKLFLFFVKIRYDLEIKGLEGIQKTSSYLILPNHISLLEPMIIRSLFTEKIKITPVATTSFAHHHLLKWLFDWIGAIAVQESNTQQKADQLSQSLLESLDQMRSVLKNGSSLLLYPSGQLAGQGLEYLGGKKSAYLATQSSPDHTKILAVRVSGLWGSIRSNARTGARPSILREFGYAIWCFVANLFFFTPKRKVVIEIIDQTKELKALAQGELIEFNQYLEAFYNANGEEQLQYLPHFFFFNDTKNKKKPEHIRNSIAELKKAKSYQEANFDENIINEIKSLLRSMKSLTENHRIELNSHLIMELYLDSLDMAEVKNELLNRYPQASNTPILELKTVADLVAMAMGLTENEKSDFKPCIWNIKNQETNWHLDEAQTILEHFKYQWKREKGATQTYDQLFGMQTRKDVVLKAFLIADYLKKIPGKNIGIMLPALTSTSILILASHLAEKIPVMMNRTHPESAFAHCLKFSNTQKILTSKTFFQKINIPRLDKYEFIFLEDLLKDIPLFPKLKALVKSLYFPLPKNTDTTAVILYTSGSEALPKAVALSHKNILSNLKGALGILNIQYDEKFFCYLPPFHSFGFTVNTILPLALGLRSVNTPDPNDSLTVAKLIEHTQPTILATTPTFLRNLMSIATRQQLASLRYIIVGGEKCPEAVFEKAKKLIPSTIIIEGYGITECSPIISINPLEQQKRGSAGISISTGEIRILDLLEKKEKEIGEEGMIVFAGESVFDGYQDKQLPSPFIEHAGKKWYKTGDLGYLDADGFLYITGREKRFLKPGGEMISLPFIENLLISKYGNPEVQNLVVEGNETENGIYLAVFTTDLEIEKYEINSFLRSQGVPTIISIDEVRKIDALPLLGNGKIDYKVLKALCKTA